MPFCIFCGPGVFLEKHFLFTFSASIMLTYLGLWSRTGSHFDILNKVFCFLKETGYVPLNCRRKYMNPTAILEGNLHGSVKIRWDMSIQYPSVWLDFRFKANSTPADLLDGIDPHESIKTLEPLWKMLHQFSKAFEIRSSAGVSQQRSVAVNRITVVHISWRGPHCIFFLIDNRIFHIRPTSQTDAQLNTYAYSLMCQGFVLKHSSLDCLG